MRNPGAFIAPGKFHFELLTNQGGKVDFGDYTVTNETMYIPSFISTFYGTISNTIAGHKPVSMRFFLRPKAKVPKDSYMIM